MIYTLKYTELFYMLISISWHLFLILIDFVMGVLFCQNASFSNDQEELDFQFDEELENQGKQPTIFSSDW